MRTNVYEKITQNIIEAMERGVVPWRRPWTVTAAPPANLRTRRPYRGINALTTWSAGYASPWWVGWCQIQELGGRIRRGERGTTIVFFKPLRRAESAVSSTREPEECEETMAPALDRPRVLLRHSHVWNVAQTEGLEANLPTTSDVLPVSPDIRAEAILIAWPDSPTISMGFRVASYRPRRDLIQMPPRDSFKDPGSYYGTLFHECVHATGHPCRLGRYQPDVELPPFGSEDYSKEELVAELGAAFLCGTVGLATEIESSAAYVASWLSVLRKDRQMLVSAAAQAQRAADYIIGKRHESGEEQMEDLPGATTEAQPV